MQSSRYIVLLETDLSVQNTDRDFTPWLANFSASGAKRSSGCMQQAGGTVAESASPGRSTATSELQGHVAVRSSHDSLPVFQEEPESRFFLYGKSPVYYVL